MNSISTVMANHDPDYILLSRKDRANLVYGALLYMFRVWNSQKFTDQLKENLGWTGQQCIDFRNTFKQKGYIQKDLKIFLYAKINKSDIDVPGITPDDKKLCVALLRSTNVNALKLCKWCRAYNRKGYTPKSVATMDKAITQIFPTLNTYCKKYVAKKFRFLTQSSQLDAESTVNGFIECGVYAIYKAYPIIMNSLHMTNIAKTSIHNIGVNMLKEQTTESRNRVKRNDDGTFSGLLLSLSAPSPAFLNPLELGHLNVCNSLMTGLDGRTVEGERPCYVDRQRDLEEVVTSLYGHATELERKFLDLLMGIEDTKFSTWLGQSNTLFMTKYDRKVYAEKAREYLRIPVETAKVFFSNLKQELGEFKN